jgi:hypothetical protein
LRKFTGKDIAGMDLIEFIEIHAEGREELG